MQWMGEEYLMQEIEDENESIDKTGEIYGNEPMFWMGYLYRYWHYLTGEKSCDIVRIAPPDVMYESWAGFHTLDNDLAIERLKELGN